VVLEVWLELGIRGGGSAGDVWACVSEINQ
jgi:hypothetical protein